VSNAVMLDMLKMSEFQNPLAGFSFSSSGAIMTPTGAKLLRTNAAPEGKLIGLDRNYALEMVKCGSIEVDYDQLIDRKVERTAIASTAGFGKIYRDAAKVLEV